MLSGFNDINPVNFVYQNDSDLLLNQEVFETQQGLSLNLVNALSGLKDEAIINYSNIFLSQKLPVNDILYIPQKQEQILVFPTYLALSGLPVLNTSLYTAISSTPSLSSVITFTSSLSNQAQTYFIFTDLNGLQCRISTIDNDITKNLTVNYNQGNVLKPFELYFSAETPFVSANRSNVFEYSLGPYGYLKLFYRTPTAFYAIRQIGNSLSAVDLTQTTSLSTDVFATTYRYQPDLTLKNNFIYYDKTDVKNFAVNEARTINDIPQNHVIYYNYQSKLNFLSGATALVDFFKTKNVLSDSYYINDKLPFGLRDVVQRDYTTILSKQNSELYNGNFQLNYNYYTKEYQFIPDVATKFTLPETLYPYKVLNVDNSNLVNNGAYGGLTPVFSDKIVKSLNINTNAVNYNEANGVYLYTWLYTDVNQLTSYWLDRYYYPQKTSLNVAYSGTNNQIFNYTSGLSSFLSSSYPSANAAYYDIRSSLTFEPSASYIYSRIGNNYINKVVNTFTTAITSVQEFNTFNVPGGSTNNLAFENNNYGAFKLNPDNDNSFTISFDLNSKNLDDVNTHLVVGNNYDEGISIYKGGIQNIYTPGYFISSLSGVDFYDHNNNFTFSLNVSSYVGYPVRVLDVVNTGFDHLIKIFYINDSNNRPGFLDFSLTDKVFNKYEFPTLSNAFNSGSRINLYDKTYVGNNQIWYLCKSAFPYNQIYKFDYFNNLYLGSQPLSTGALSGFNSFVMLNDQPVTLSGFKGNKLNEDLGVSKFYNTIYFKNLKANTEYSVLCTAGGIFDLLFDNNGTFYVQNANTIRQYNKYKQLLNTFTNNSSAVSGLKLDFVNEDYTTKLLSLNADSNGHITIDKFNLQTNDLESSFNTGIEVSPLYFGEFYTPKRGVYNKLQGVGIINSNFVSAGVVNDYTQSAKLIDSLTAININAIVGAVSYDCNLTSTLTGTVTLFDNSPIPTDVSLNLYQGSTYLTTVTADGKSSSINLFYTGLVPNTPYSLECKRVLDSTLGVNLQLEIGNGTFWNGSFRNVVIGGQYTYPNVPTGFANAFYAINNIDLTDQLGFVHYVDSFALSSNYGLLPTTTYSSNVVFNTVSNQNPYYNFYHNYNNPHLNLVVNPSFSTFQPNVIEFVSDLNPPLPSLSGIPLQTPVNFENILRINKFDQGNMVMRLDLFSGNNYLNKQTVVAPFDIENNSQVVISFDVNNGYVRIYNNAELIKDVSLSANTFYSSYFLNNNFGVGMPFIDNIAASVVDTTSDVFAKNYSLNNFVVYNRPLNSDEVKFNYLKNQKIDALNFDITAGTRNDTDTVTSFNRMSIPGRKNNNIRIIIKNANLTENGKLNLTEQLYKKIKNIVPINTSNIDIEYINYD